MINNQFESPPEMVLQDIQNRIDKLIEKDQKKWNLLSPKLMQHKINALKYLKERIKETRDISESIKDMDKI